MDSPILARIASLVHRRARKERRQAKRLPPAQPAVCLVYNQGESEPAPACVQNLSIKGAAILADRAYAVDTALRVLLVNASHTYAVTAELRVVRCLRVVSGQHLLGGPFARPLAYEEFVPLML
jgi:hypothetical protein